MCRVIIWVKLGVDLWKKYTLCSAAWDNIVGLESCLLWLSLIVLINIWFCVSFHTCPHHSHASAKFPSLFSFHSPFPIPLNIEPGPYFSRVFHWPCVSFFFNFPQGICALQGPGQALKGCCSPCLDHDEDMLAFHARWNGLSFHSFHLPTLLSITCWLLF